MEFPIEGPVYGDTGTYVIQTKKLSYTFHSLYDEYRHFLFWKSVKVSPRFIVKNVDFEARPGEITAIAGPSGAGKTTLLEILAGKISPRKVSGEVLVNDHPMHIDSYRRLSGYVTQEDVLFPLLTVEEVLTYGALLRVSGGKRVAKHRVKVLMKELGLEHISGSRIGEGSSHGISGGERRRVSIGMELVHDPAVLLIDEPTSGLDSASALHVISLLKMMAVSQGKTIILTIHQPGFRILELFDRLVLLSNGYVLHNGSLDLLEERLKKAGYHIPPHINVLEFAIDISSSITIKTSEAPNSKPVFETDVESEGSAENSCHSVRISTSCDKKKFPSYSNSQFREVLILGERFCKNIFRTKELFATRIIQAVVVGFILGTIYMNVTNNIGKVALQSRLGFFAFSLSFLLSSMTEGLPIFLQERRILMRETSRGAYRVLSYVLANTIVFLPFLLMVGLLFSTPVYWLIGLRRDLDGFLYFFLVVWVVVLMSNSFTACCSALVPNFIMGTSIIAGLMGAFFLFSGYFIAQENIPSYWIFMHYLSLFKYPFESLVINEYGGKGSNKCLEILRDHCILYGNGYLKQQGLEESQKWTNMAVMLGFVLGYRVLCFLILWFRCYRTRH